MKIKRIVTGITSLDEARYFSAMGVDWMGFDASRLTAAKVQAILSWVVGPQFFTEWDHVEEEELFAFTDATGIAGICLPLSAAVPAWFHGTCIRKASAQSLTHTLQSGNILLITEGLDAFSSGSLDAVCTSCPCWLETNPDVSPAGYFGRPAPDGIVIRCNQADSGHQTGFDRFDRFFEAMDEIDGSEK